MSCKNKAWQKPEMTVLVRSNPEEVVLGNCKTSNSSGPHGAGVGACVNTGGQICSVVGTS